MKISVVLADVVRPNGPGAVTLNCLNAGWNLTMAQPVPEEHGTGYTLPPQAVAIFLEGSWDQLNRPLTMVLELVDDEGQHAQLAVAPGQTQHARIEHEMTIPSVPGAPNGTPGTATFMMELGPTVLRIPVPRRRYIWRVSIDGAVGEAGFWVQAPQPTPPVIGRPAP